MADDIIFSGTHDFLLETPAKPVQAPNAILFDDNNNRNITAIQTPIVATGGESITIF